MTGMENPFNQLMKRHQKGNRPAVHLGPFLPLTRIRQRGLSFNDVMRDSHVMTEAALMSFEFGFESTVLPFDEAAGPYDAVRTGVGPARRARRAPDCLLPLSPWACLAG